MEYQGFYIGHASEADVQGILEIQAENQLALGGMLSAKFPRAYILDLIRQNPLIVAKSDETVVAYLITSTPEMNAEIPIIRAMLDAYRGSEDAYIYGPVCVKAAYRGKGLAQAMFAELRRLQPGREWMLFIRRDNRPSLRAHAKMGMQEVADFEFDGSDHVVLSYIG